MIVTGTILAGAVGCGSMISYLASTLTTRRMVHRVVQDAEDGFKARDQKIAQTRADLDGLNRQVSTNLTIQNQNIERLLESSTAIAVEVRSLRLAGFPTAPAPAATKRPAKRATESVAAEPAEFSAAEQAEPMKPKLQKQTDLVAV